MATADKISRRNHTTLRKERIKSAEGSTETALPLRAPKVLAQVNCLSAENEILLDSVRTPAQMQHARALCHLTRPVFRAPRGS